MALYDVKGKVLIAGSFLGVFLACISIGTAHWSQWDSFGITSYTGPFVFRNGASAWEIKQGCEVAGLTLLTGQDCERLWRTRQFVLGALTAAICGSSVLAYSIINPTFQRNGIGALLNLVAGLLGFASMEMWMKIDMMASPYVTYGQRVQLGRSFVAWTFAVTLWLLSVTALGNVCQAKRVKPRKGPRVNFLSTTTSRRPPMSISRSSSASAVSHIEDAEHPKDSDMSMDFSSAPG
eukprot:gb/GEZN01017872.1/.p1 GENE.gb/GEZN01017872.1/~~gb/GEZN01017872.1/.p1  ORF type:complete len:236 (-),score=4.58 gb/GEZN01017872.1/:33-740(-)